MGTCSHLLPRMKTHFPRSLFHFSNKISSNVYLSGSYSVCAPRPTFSSLVFSFPSSPPIVGAHIVLLDQVLSSQQSGVLDADSSWLGLLPSGSLTKDNVGSGIKIRDSGRGCKGQAPCPDSGPLLLSLAPPASLPPPTYLPACNLPSWVPSQGTTYAIPRPKAGVGFANTDPLDPWI